ncbi:MAG: AmmeMemoRadiSam system protein A [Gammaproteobacteria bacterium]|nr:AmmeMemoRadiSam system protein A [Gammaproteobacteria bacterium]
MTRPLDKNSRKLLLQLAEDSIRHGLEYGAPLPVALGSFPESLHILRATFVTLNQKETLRGCIGSLEATHPLVEDVSYNAYAAAFSDPRFPPLLTTELSGLEIHISILSPPDIMNFDSEQALLSQLRPGIDGLILQDKGRRGTFLPSVWQSLPQASDFLTHLKLKAGLAADYWSNTLTVQRYTTESLAQKING